MQLPLTTECFLSAVYQDYYQAAYAMMTFICVCFTGDCRVMNTGRAGEGEREGGGGWEGRGEGVH